VSTQSSLVDKRKDGFRSQDGGWPTVGPLGSSRPSKLGPTFHRQSGGLRARLAAAPIAPADAVTSHAFEMPPPLGHPPGMDAGGTEALNSIGPLSQGPLRAAGIPEI
jgi:hypothetical protein